MPKPTSPAIGEFDPTKVVVNSDALKGNRFKDVKLAPRPRLQVRIQTKERPSDDVWSDDIEYTYNYANNDPELRWFVSQEADAQPGHGDVTVEVSRSTTFNSKTVVASAVIKEGNGSYPFHDSLLVLPTTPAEPVTNYVRIRAAGGWSNAVRMVLRYAIE